MSETAKTADFSKKVTDNAARSGQAALDTAARVTKESMTDAANVAQNATDRARAVGRNMTDTMAETAHAATNLSSKLADENRDTMTMGMRTAAGVSGRVADISFGRGQRLLSSTAQAMDIYRDASERSAERVQALFSSAMTWSRGLQRMQHAWLEMVDNTMGNATHKPQDLLRCKNIVELAEVQRDLYLDAINHAFDSTTRLLDIAGRTAQDAVRPLQSHAN